MASRGINKVLLIGNVGQDPDLRYMPSGGAVCNLPMATSETWKDRATGEQHELTEWTRLVFFNRLAEIVGDYVRKGSKLYVEGSLRTRKWTDQNDTERYTTEVVVRDMQMLDKRGTQTEGEAYRQATQSSADSSGAQQPLSDKDQGFDQNFDNFDDDITF